MIRSLLPCNIILWVCDFLLPWKSSPDDDSVIICLFIVGASVPSPLMAVGDSDFRSSWGFVCFVHFLCRLVYRFSVISFSSCLFCHLVFFFFFHFLGLLSHHFCFCLLGRLLGCIFGRGLVISSVFFVFLYFLLFFFVLSFLLAILSLFLFSFVLSFS